MDQAQLSLAASLHALITQQNAVANNLANISSTAFKRRAGAFEPFAFVLDQARGGSLPVPRYREYGDFRQGDIRYTGNPMHIAIQGTGFMRVRPPGDESRVSLRRATFFFTRSGTLTVDVNGRLLTEDGFEILDESLRPITVNPGAELKISQTGEVIDGTSGGVLGRIALWRIPNPVNLLPLGAGLFKGGPRAGTPELDRFSRIQQKHLENSNVNSLQELVSMISVQRHFEAAARALGIVEQVNDRLNQLARG